MSGGNALDRVLRGMLITLALGCVVLYGYLLWRGDLSFGSVPSAPTGQENDLWQAYGYAYAAARAEADDARIVSASTQWQAPSERALFEETPRWTFVFYSSTDKVELDVVVDDDAGRVVNRTRVWNAPSLLTGALWRAGPDEALRVFLDDGGRGFLSTHPQAVVDLHLRAGDERSAVWNVTALDASDRSLISLRIDANRYEVLSRAP